MKLTKRLKEAKYLYGWNRSTQRHQYQCKCSPNAWYVSKEKEYTCKWCHEPITTRRTMNIPVSAYRAWKYSVNRV